ncbi:MAG: phosphohydrolase [Thermoplasmata archaeon]|nr:MAG: phosphohydrolase [Thermoplasmata archaeon]
MINRSEALEILDHYIHEENLLHHVFLVETIMISTAESLQQDSDLWGLVGLLHDLDYEYTGDQPEKHGILTGQILEDLIPDTGIHAILAHNYVHTEVIPTSILDKALIASDSVSGLILASAKIMPDKKLSQLTLSSLKKKMKDNSFAKGCNRDKILLCQDFGIDINDFLDLSLKSSQKIHDKLKL